MSILNLSNLPTYSRPETEGYKFNDRLASFDLIAQTMQDKADMLFSVGQSLEAEILQHKIYLKAESLIKVFPPYDSEDLYTLKKISEYKEMIRFLESYL